MMSEEGAPPEAGSNAGAVESEAGGNDSASAEQKRSCSRCPRTQTSERFGFRARGRVHPVAVFAVDAIASARAVAQVVFQLLTRVLPLDAQALPRCSRKANQVTQTAMRSGIRICQISFWFKLITLGAER